MKQREQCILDTNEFRLSNAEWGFGQSEGSDGTIKHLMRKATEDGRDVHLDLLEYRNTPISGLEYSPTQLLMSPKPCCFPNLPKKYRSLCQLDIKDKRNTMIMILEPCPNFRMATL